MRSLSIALAWATCAIASPLAAQTPAKLLAVQFGTDESKALINFYPASDLLRNRSAGAVIKLTFAPNGKVIGCDLVESVGDVGLAGRICGFAKRIKWKPARDRVGQAAFGVTTTIVTFLIPGTPQGDLVRQTRLEPDVIAKIKDVSFLASGGADVKVSLQIDPSGKLAACEPVAPTEALMAKSACGFAEQLKFDGLKDPTGVPVTYVTERKIRLISDATVSLPNK